MLHETSLDSPTRVFESELGWIGFTGSELGMTSLTFGHDCPEDVIERLNFEHAHRYSDSLAVLDRGVLSDCSEDFEPHWMQAAQDLLQAYSRGEPVDLNLIPCDISHRTKFEQRVREQLSRIGYGQTITYGQLAEAAGAPRAARAVGTVMSRNPIPLVIACHRVVAADGKLGGYTSPAGLSMKERLIQMEQSQFDSAFEAQVSFAVEAE